MKKTKTRTRFNDGTHKPILVGPTVAEYEKIRIASAHANLPMAQFLLLHGLAVAEKILDKSRK